METTKDNLTIFNKGIAYYEQNLIDNPFFIFSTKDLNRLTRPVEFFDARLSKTPQTQWILEHRYTDKKTGEDVVWKLKPDTERGFPGPLDQDVLATVKKLVVDRDLPPLNPVVLPPWSELCRIMGKPVRYTPLIRESMKRIAATVVETNCFQSRDRAGKRINLSAVDFKTQIFTLWSYFERGTELPDGIKTDYATLWVNPPFSESLLSHYLRPYDYEFFMSLSPLAKRIYTIEGRKFYGLRNCDHTCETYSAWCKQLPIVEQPYLSKAKQTLKTAHNELLKAEFFKSVTWEQTRKKGPWKIYYTPGRRALMEVQEGRKRKAQRKRKIQSMLNLEQRSMLELFVEDALKVIDEQANDVTRKFLYKAGHRLGPEAVERAARIVKADFVNDPSMTVKKSLGHILVDEVKAMAKNRKISLR